MIFFSIWVFFHQHLWITGLRGKREGISLTPHYHFHSLHRHLTMIRVVILNIYVNHQSYLKQFLNPSWKLFALMKSLTMCNNQTSIYIYIYIYIYISIDIYIYIYIYTYQNIQKICKSLVEKLYPEGMIGISWNNIYLQYLMVIC